MDEQQLRTFLAIAETGSINRAAEMLGRAQPTLSQLLLRLEEEIGVRLFHRGPKGVSLTEAGRVFQQRSRIILSDMSRAKEEVRNVRAQHGGLVHVGLPSSLGLLLGPTIILETMERHPGISVHMAEAMSGDIRRWLEEGRIEIGLLHDVDALRHLAVRRLASEELMLVGTPEAMSRLPHGVEPVGIACRTVTPKPMILPSKQHGLRQFVDRRAQEYGISIQADIEVDSLVQIKSMVVKAAGYTILPQAAVHDEIDTARLKIARLIEPTFERTVYLARNPNREMTKASIQVEDVMTNCMKELVSGGKWLARWEESL